jgi:cyclohexanecarboxyl-CoA dehydrogenase
VGGLCALGLQKAALEIQKDYLEPMMRGDKIAAFALTEPHCGTDAAAIKMRSVKTIAGYKLSGEKSGISLAMLADFAVVFAKTNPSAKAKGISAFLVPMDIPGVTRQPLSDMGGKSLERGLIFLDEAEVPQDHILGVEGEGFKIAMQGFDESRVHLALMCLGAAQATIQETIAYTKERRAFHEPIARFEGVSFVLAEHASLIESVRLLCYKALWMKEQGLKHSKEAGFVKALAPRLATNAIRDCLALHGHYGYTLDLPIEQRLRDILGLEIADGTSQVSKIVAVRELFGKEYLPYGQGSL